MHLFLVGTTSPLLSIGDDIFHLQRGAFLYWQEYPWSVVTIRYKDGLVESPVSQCYSGRFGGGRLVCLFCTPFSLSVPLASLLPITCFHFSSWNDDQEPYLPVFQETSSCKACVPGRGSLTQVLPSHNLQPRRSKPKTVLFSLYSCSFPEVVALTVEVAHHTNPLLPWDLDAVLRAQLPRCLCCSYPAPSLSLRAHPPSSWLVGGRAASTRRWYSPSLCHHMCKQSAQL